ncbi:MAG: hypothetical protein ACRELD_07350, partial [Longimicrobiales bacterium]
HEPEPRQLRALERRLEAAGLAHARLSRLEAGDSRASDRAAHTVLIDRVGLLVDAYALGDLAYVGGGFGGGGLHSVIEPAAQGLPVLFGRRHGNTREAELLRDAGGGVECADGRTLEAAITRLIDDDGRRRRAGEVAALFVRERLGGDVANAALLLKVVRRTAMPLA